MQRRQFQQIKREIQQETPQQRLECERQSWSMLGLPATTTSRGISTGAVPIEAHIQKKKEGQQRIERQILSNHVDRRR